MLIPTPLLLWYLQTGLVVTRLCLLMKYDRRSCSQTVVLCSEMAIHPDGPITVLSQWIGKAIDDQLVQEMLREQDMFPQDVHCKGLSGQQSCAFQPLQGHEAFVTICPKLPLGTRSKLDTKDMSADGWEPGDDLETMMDHYGLAMAPERITMDLPFQITVLMFMPSCLWFSSVMTCWASTWKTDVGNLFTQTLVAGSTISPFMSTVISGSLARPVMGTGPSSWTSWQAWGLVPGTQCSMLRIPSGCMMKRHQICLKQSGVVMA